MVLAVTADATTVPVWRPEEPPVCEHCSLVAGRMMRHHGGHIDEDDET